MAGSLILTSGATPCETTIHLETARGNRIDNAQITELSAFELNQLKGLTKGRPTVIQRTGPSPRYNCHGLTFASRRTGIYDLSSIETILSDDGYEEVPDDQVIAGDVIVYYGETGDPQHSGIVVEGCNEFRIPLVVSKWGKAQEFVHWGNDSPYGYIVRFFRIRVSC